MENNFEVVTTFNKEGFEKYGRTMLTSFAKHGI